MRSTYRHQPQRKFYQTNFRIQAATLRVINQEGKQLGVITRDEALRQAQDEGLDLVLIAPNTQPPVAKIINFKKFLYQEEKKLRSAKKGIKKSIVKDISLSLFIAQGDLERLEKKAREFLEEGNQVRINLTLRGREMIKRDMAFEHIKKFIVSLGDVNVSKEPRMEGRVIRAVVGRKK